MLRVYQGLRSYGTDGNFDGWLFQIAANVWRNELRRDSALKRDVEEVPLDQAMATGELNGPEHVVLADERIQQLREALDDLPPQMRRCVLLRIDQDLRYWEIAEVMQLSEATIKSQMHQARQRLKIRLEPYFAHSPTRG